VTRQFQNIALLKGGPSAEREVSLVSGHECAAGLRRAGYSVTEIDAGPDLAERLREIQPDAVFNALHGRWGEDGCVQGTLEWLGIPYTHSGVLASALAMDKERAKQVFASAGLPIAESVLASPADIATRHVLPPPYVVKPYNEGSSVGIHIIGAGSNAFADVDVEGAPDALMVERYVPGRELTTAVLHDRALAVTEIVTSGWYDYAAKYQTGGSKHIVPAEISSPLTERCLDIARAAHDALGCRGATRSDFRYDPQTDELVLLEVNTQPGMTPTSLVPEQAAHVGMSFEDLVSWIVEDSSCQR